MNIVVASSNKGKIEEIKKLLPQYNVIPYTDITDQINIDETGSTFQQNSILKVEAIKKKLEEIAYKKTYIIIADDSGISVPALNNEPNIYSARYAKVGATDQENNNKLIENLKKRDISKTKAYYTAAIAISFQDKIYTTHGWMWGDITTQPKGENGFGYDPLFIPNGYSKTLGELDFSIKKKLSHRSKALNLAMKIINILEKNIKI